MNNENYKKLIQDFPNLFTYHTDDKQLIECGYPECSDGWFDVVYNCSSRISEICKDIPFDEHPKIEQIKEKYGQLRYYISHTPAHLTTQIYKAIEYAEKISEQTCEVCGKSGSLIRSSGWWYTACQEHTKN